MTSTQKRKLVVNGIQYEWCLRGNRISDKSEHVTIYRPDTSGQPLYLDALPWEVEIRPKIVKEAILFALSSAWTPDKKGPPFRLGVVEGEFVQLPDGVKNSFEFKELKSPARNSK